RPLAVRGERDELGGSDLDPLGLAALRVEREQLVDTSKWLPGTAGVDHMVVTPSFDPAHHAGLTTVEGEPASGPPATRHHVDLGHTLVGPDEGEVAAVGRKHGESDVAEASGQSSGHPPVERGLPQIVL